MITADYQFISKPHRSLCAESRFTLFLLLSIIPILIGVSFTLLGLWIIFPFIGLELFALAFAFYCFNCHDDDYESITIEDNKLIVKKHSYKHTTQFELNACWVQVMIIRAPNGSLRLCLRSQGKEIQFGSHMNNQQCSDLAEQLKKRIGSAYMH